MVGALHWCIIIVVVHYHCASITNESTYTRHQRFENPVLRNLSSQAHEVSLHGVVACSVFSVRTVWGSFRKMCATAEFSEIKNVQSFIAFCCFVLFRSQANRHLNAANPHLSL